MAELDAVFASVNKGSDKKEDMVLLTSSDSNWARFLTPAPLAISLLGELMLISSDTDFDLSENEPVGGFKFLRHPSSFRASLVQVSNEGWSAFNQAHTNMDQIRLYSAGVEEHIRSAVKLLLAGSTDEISHILPKTLGRVSDIADTCKDLAECIEKKFDRVMDVTGELLEVSSSAQGQYDKKYQETVAALESAKLQKKMIEIDQNEMKERCKMLENDMKRAHDDYNTAMKKMPGSASMLAFSLAEGLVNGVRGLCSLFSPDTWSSSSSRVNFSNEHTTDISRTPSSTEKMNKYRAYTKAFGLERLVAQLTEISTCKSRNGKQYPDLQAIKDHKVKAISASFDRIKSSMLDSQTKTSPEETVIKISRKGQEICERLESLVALLSNDRKGKCGKKIGDDACELLKKAQKFLAKAKMKTATNILDEQPYNLRQVTHQQKKTSIVEAENENARLKVETAKHILTDARERHERAFEEMKKDSEELQKVIREMAALNPKTVDFETIRSTLVKGIRALGDLREQWGRFVRFFQSMSNLIKCSLHTTLHSFVDTAKEKKQLTIKGSPGTKAHLDILIEQASKANQFAFSVQTIAGTYVAVSDEHLMDRISGLAKLIALGYDNSKNAQTRIEIEREKLHTGTENAQQAITRLMIKESQDYNNRVEERKRRLQVEIESVLPPISTVRLQEIKDTVSEGITKSEEDLSKEVDDII